jgi:hypothetical protein
MSYESYASNDSSGEELMPREVETFPAPRRGGRRADKEYLSPAMIDAELYEMAKQRVNERFNLTMHLAAYVSCTVGLTVCAGIFWKIAALFGFAIMGWSIGMFMHIIFYFAKANPNKILKEYEKLRRKLR